MVSTEGTSGDFVIEVIVRRDGAIIAHDSKDLKVLGHTSYIAGERLARETITRARRDVGAFAPKY